MAESDHPTFQAHTRDDDELLEGTLGLRNTNETKILGKIILLRWSTCVLKTDTVAEMTRDAGNLFQHFTTRTEKAQLLH